MSDKPMETECLRCGAKFVATIAQAMKHDEECKRKVKK